MKRAIPAVMQTDPYEYALLSAMRDNLNAIMGIQTGTTRLNLLPTTATLADVIVAINALNNRLNFK